jgi:hypothetical protein
MNLHTRISPGLLCLIFGLSFCPHQISAQAPAATQQLRDEQHDFDFRFGTWHIHFHFLLQPLTGSDKWVESDGTVTVRQIWSGRANLEELEAGSPGAPFEGMTLLLYNPQTHRWNQSFANSKDGALSAPLVGEFRNGRGEFYGEEKHNGRTVLVRFVWSDITPNSYHIEQSYSADGGKSWEPNLSGNATRNKE